jgi:hypothetical protein
VQPFDLRHAAASSLNTMPSIWTYNDINRAFESVRLRIILLTYDVLNDDDEELRDIGASIAKTILEGNRSHPGTSDHVPLVASQKLAGYLVKNYRSSTELCRDAIKRMTGSQISVSGDYIHPSSIGRLENAVKEDTALFVIEKQNLFVDEVRKAILWSQVLKNLSTRAITQSLATELTKWVKEGLDALTLRIEAEYDGALGWCSKPDVFIFFMQIICAADVLMVWRLRTKKVQVRGSQVRMALVRLLTAGIKNGLHEMLAERIERVLMESTTARLRKLGKRLIVAERTTLDGRSS